jgi:hypothetical protein
LTFAFHSCIIVILRLVTSAYLRTHTDDYSPFLFALEDDPRFFEEGAPDMKGFCERYVEASLFLSPSPLRPFSQTDSSLPPFSHRLSPSKQTTSPSPLSLVLFRSPSGSPT